MYDRNKQLAMSSNSADFSNTDSLDAKRMCGGGAAKIISGLPHGFNGGALNGPAESKAMPVPTGFPKPVVVRIK